MAHLTDLPVLPVLPVLPEMSRNGNLGIPVLPVLPLGERETGKVREVSAGLMPTGANHQSASALIAAINRCCDLRGDTDRTRDALIAEAAALTAEQQVDMTDHFLGECRLWLLATGQSSHTAARAAKPAARRAASTLEKKA